MGKHFGLISVFLICSGCQATTELSTLHLFCGLTESKKVLVLLKIYEINKKD